MKPFLKFYTFLIILFEILSINCSNSRSIEKEDQSAVKGEWIIIDQTISPLAIIPHCKSIQHGTTFTFRRYTLEVYTGDSAKPCSIYKFKIAANTLSVSKGDMVWLCNFQIKSDSLKLISENFFTPDDSNIPISANKPSPQIKEIVITLIRKTN